MKQERLRLERDAFKLYEPFFEEINFNDLDFVILFSLKAVPAHYDYIDDPLLGGMGVVDIASVQILGIDRELVDLLSERGRQRIENILAVRAY